MAQTALLSPDGAKTLRLPDAIQASASGIVSRTVLQSPDLRIVLFTFAAGQELTPHTSRRRAVIQILDGVCDFFFADRWERLAAGSLLHLPPNELHAVRATDGEFTMLLTLGAEPPPTAGTA